MPVIELPAEELGTRTDYLLERLRAGDTVRLTLDGWTVGEVTPMTGGRTWVPKDEFLANLKQADPGMRDDLREFWAWFEGRDT